MRLFGRLLVEGLEDRFAPALLTLLTPADLGLSLTGSIQGGTVAAQVDLSLIAVGATTSLNVAVPEIPSGGTPLELGASLDVEAAAPLLGGSLLDLDTEVSAVVDVGVLTAESSLDLGTSLFVGLEAASLGGGSLLDLGVSVDAGVGVGSSSEGTPLDLGTSLDLGLTPLEPGLPNPELPDLPLPGALPDLNGGTTTGSLPIGPPDSVANHLPAWQPDTDISLSASDSGSLHWIQTASSMSEADSFSGLSLSPNSNSTLAIELPSFASISWVSEESGGLGDGLERGKEAYLVYAEDFEESEAFISRDGKVDAIGRGAAMVVLAANPEVHETGATDPVLTDEAALDAQMLGGEVMADFLFMPDYQDDSLAQSPLLEEAPPAEISTWLAALIIGAGLGSAYLTRWNRRRRDRNLDLLVGVHA